MPVYQAPYADASVLAAACVAGVVFESVRCLIWIGVLAGVDRGIHQRLVGYLSSDRVGVVRGWDYASFVDIGEMVGGGICSGDHVVVVVGYPAHQIVCDRSSTPLCGVHVGFSKRASHQPSLDAGEFRKSALRPC